jgi:uncharacterized alpha/beta hydrolase family protein
MRMIISIMLSLILVLIIASVLSYFVFIKDNRQNLDVYVDAQGKIYINGVISTEQRASSLVNDPRYIPSISYHPDAAIHYCFGSCQ